MSISGKFLSATYGAGPTTIAGTHEWSVGEDADELEATTGAHNGRAKKDAGVVETVFNLRLYLDVTSGIYTTLRAATTLATLKLYARSAATTPLYTVTSATIFSMKLAGQVRDRFIVDLKVRADGDVVTAAEPN